MPASSEWHGEPHTLIVTAVTAPSGPLDDGEMEYTIEHPPSCKQEEVTWDGQVHGMVWTCDVAHSESESGLPFTLRYSGTPITEPGTYQVQSWGRKYYVWDVGAYEYDAGIGLVEENADDPGS